MRQKGFTLIELLVAMAVGGVVMAGALAATYQVVWGTSRTNSQVVALNDVHQTALQLKKDLETAQSTDLTDGVPRDYVTLEWTDYTSFVVEETKKHARSYVLSNGELQRTYDGTMSIVGRNITSVSFTQDERVINVAITATAGDMSPRSETLEFSVYPVSYTHLTLPTKRIV